ncbi:hypothetical protein SAMN02982929_03855 [Saccharopolyspora kobensis]|uniref:CopG family transcriptional regulator n=1 Tax=Saccharopolyspora kobensis TaxID=146035 RepID=A0A1H6D247_9PSEU|nr:hypothetical protein [Saccharopolyspora kobensis]SEG79439.1 hypothetical protein SAMN02982929_03855 [Saccharopolyspora kobensis]SFD08267.1 hypothetical protein SAMN05216506_102450 [Saccharopolyspora kobensis]
MSALPNDPAGGLERGRDFTERLALLLSQYREFDEPAQDDAASAGSSSNVRSLGRARKVSVSMPEELTAAVQSRVGRGAFSQYVTDAVARQLELDLLAELSGLLDAEHGQVPEELLAEARAAWPDTE